MEQKKKKGEHRPSILNPVPPPPRLLQKEKIGVNRRQYNNGPWY